MNNHGAEVKVVGTTADGGVADGVRMAKIVGVPVREGTCEVGQDRAKATPFAKDTTRSMEV